MLDDRLDAHGRAGRAGFRLYMDKQHETAVACVRSSFRWTAAVRTWTEKPFASQVSLLEEQVSLSFGVFKGVPYSTAALDVCWSVRDP